MSGLVTQGLIFSGTGMELTSSMIIVLSTALTLLIQHALISYRLGRIGDGEHNDWTEVNPVDDGAEDADAMPDRDNAGQAAVPAMNEGGHPALEVDALRIGIERTGRHISGFLIPRGLKVRGLKANLLSCHFAEIESTVA